MGYTRRSIPSRSGSDPALGGTLGCCVQLWGDQDRRDKELQQRVTKMSDLEHLPEDQRLKELGLRGDLSPTYPRGNVGGWIQALLHGAQTRDERKGQEMMPGKSHRNLLLGLPRDIPQPCGQNPRAVGWPSWDHTPLYGPLTCPTPLPKPEVSQTPLLRDFKPRSAQTRLPRLTFSAESLMQVL